MKKLSLIIGFFAVVGIIFLAFKSGNDLNSFNGKIGKHLQEAIVKNSESNFIVWVYLNDKGPDAMQKLSNPLAIVSEKSLERRKKVLPENQLLDYTDIPVSETYLNNIRQNVIKVRVVSKWLNSVSVEVTPSQIYELASKDFVKKIEKVERYRKINDSEDINFDGSKLTEKQTDSPLVDSLNYGTSATQMTLIKANVPHNNGVYGQGVIVANFDAGYQNLNHEAFATLPMKIWKKKDFHTGDTVTLASHSHGQATLSLVGGYMPGQLISPAFRSTYVLCRTEVDPTETPIEMDHWIAAAEWVDSLGADVITSSLGYLEFDPPYTSYSWTDMNGNTVPITIAADMAVHKGIAVFNSAGNNGESTHNTLGAPADGDSVITIGATTSAGVKASYSSVGPTTDTPPRIKPDIMTQGSGNKVATQTGYSTFGSGTSWACPMAAGVGAQMLSANKNLTPIQIRNILRKFANNSASPNNLVGWGLVDAEKAVDSARKLDNTAPTITHTQPFTQTTSTSAITVKAVIKDNGIIRYTRTNEAPRIYFRKYTGGTWSSYTSANFTSVNLDTFYFQITGSSYITTVEYYFAAQDIALPTPKVSTLPAGGSGINPPGSTAPSTRFSYVVSPASVIKEENTIATEFKLFNNYPNPFNPVTNIKFSIIESSQVKLNVYDISGRMVTQLVNMQMTPGVYTYQFNAAELSSGIYFYRLEAGKNTAVNKMLLVK
jgi:hypothetical protein